MPAMILVADDDKTMREGICELMRREGYDVETACSCAQTREKCALRPDLILLDVMMPDGDGFSLCREMREKGMDIPVLFLTAYDAEEQIVKGLDSGGDDYIAKPFRMRELLSRVRAQLRRTYRDSLRSGDMVIEENAVYIDGAEVPLTRTEVMLLRILVSRAGSTVSRENILGRIWDDGETFVDDNTLSVNISRLREKIGPDRIATVRGLGYKYIAREGDGTDA